MVKGFNENPKRFYGYVRTLQRVKQSIQIIKKKDGSLTAMYQEAAQELSDGFGRVFVDEPNTRDGRGADSGPELDIVFDREDVARRLRKLVPNKSQGPDAIHP